MPPDQAGRARRLGRRLRPGAEGALTKAWGRVVVLARFVEGLRQANGIIAGIAEMHWARFLAFNAEVTFRPVMNPQDLLSAGPDMEKAAKAH